MDQPKRPVTILFGFRNDPKSVNVREARETLVFFIHLAPDRERLLLAAKNPRRQSRIIKKMLNVLFDLRDHIIGLFLQRDEPAHNRCAGLWIENLKGQILQLFAHPLHPHAAGKRCKNIHRLTRFEDLLILGHRLKGPHIVQPVTQFDQDHAHILGHGENQFPNILGLLHLDRRQLQIGQLGHAVDHLGDIIAKAFLDFAIGCAGIFQRIMQQCRDDRGIVQSLRRQNQRDFNRVREIGLAGSTHLSVMLFFCKSVGLCNQLGIRLGIVGDHMIDQGLDGDQPVIINCGLNVRRIFKRLRATFATRVLVHFISCASISARSKFSSLISSSGSSLPPPINNAISSSSGSSTSICVWLLSIAASRS